MNEIVGNLNHEEDPHLKPLNEFLNNWDLKHNNDRSILGCHNVYLLQTEDREGNITGQAFALNVTTNNYFRYFYENTQASGRPSNFEAYITRLFIGDGSGTPSPSNPSLFHAITGTVMTNTSNDQTRIESGTVYYNADTGLLSSTAWVLTGYFDYVISGITDTVHISEIGMTSQSNSYNYLMTHAMVYDSEGQPATIDKHVNEKLTITAYIRIFHKPGYIENKLWDEQGIMFAWNPWAMCAFGWTGTAYNWNAHYNGSINGVVNGYFSSPRWYNNNSSYYYNQTDQECRAYSIGSGRNIFNSVSSGTTSFDSTNMIITDTESFGGNNALLENTGLYLDMAYFQWQNQSYIYDNPYFRYASNGGALLPIHLPEPEEIDTDWAYAYSATNPTLTGNFGHPYNNRRDIRGLLPITNYQVSALKSYNGITHDWDIDETVINASNTYNLSMMQLYPVVGIYMNCPYYENNQVKTGRQFVRIYFNLYSSYPIASITTTYISASNIWCTDTYWDTTSWERIADPTNVPASQGAKKYIIGFGGEISGNGGSNTSTRPVVVTRSGYTEPQIDADTTITFDNIDPYVEGPSGSVTNSGNYLSKWRIHRYHIPSDSMGYVWMSDHLFYPDQNVSWRIQTSQRVGNMGTPIASLRFTEPSGHRILQIFRASNENQYPTPCLSKVSVFDIPSESEIALDPTLTPTEYIVELGSTFPNNHNCDSNSNFFMTSTETGYVIFVNPSTSRVHIVNILGDEDSNYEPYQFILSDGDNNEIVSWKCWAIKYTNRIVYIDPGISDSENFGFTIYDLGTKTIVDQFTMSKSGWYSIDWIIGWQNALFISGRPSSDFGTWKSRLYDMNRPAGSRLVDPEWSSAFSFALTPGGSADSWRAWTWNKLMFPHTGGDEECVIVTWNRGNNGDTMSMWYIDNDHLSSPYQFNNSQYTCGMMGPSYNEYSSRLLFRGWKFNNDKQRIIIGDTNIDRWYYYDYSSNTQYKYYSLFFDGNWIRDKRSQVTRMNLETGAPRIVGITNTNYMMTTSLRSCCMYKGKVFISEYDPSFYYNSNNRATPYTGNKHRLVDPKLLIPHRMEGTTTTIQAYNNPKRIYLMSGVVTKVINSAGIWDPSDMPPQT